MFLRPPPNRLKCPNRCGKLFDDTTIGKRERAKHVKHFCPKRPNAARTRPPIPIPRFRLVPAPPQPMLPRKRPAGPARGRATRSGRRGHQENSVERRIFVTNSFDKGGSFRGETKICRSRRWKLQKVPFNISDSTVQFLK